MNEYEDDFEYDGEVPDCDDCLLCGCEGYNIAQCDRWKWVRDDGEEFWLCRECHNQFNTKEQFLKFIEDQNRHHLFQCASRLRRFMILNAPACIVADTVKLIAARVLSDPEAADRLKKDLKKILAE